MIPNGIRMAGTIPYRNRVIATWVPNIVSPWWVATGDTIDINAPTDDYGFTPTVQSTVTGVLGNVTYNLINAGGYGFLGTTRFGAIGRPTTFVCSNFGMVWDGSGIFTGQDDIKIGLSTTRGVNGNDSYICFSHNKGGAPAPGQNWQCICAYDPTQPNSASFTADSGVPPNTGQELKITISADGKTIKWYIDGAQVASVVGDATHIYFDPNGQPIVARNGNSGISNYTHNTISGSITIMQ